MLTILVSFKITEASTPLVVVDEEVIGRLSHDINIIGNDQYDLYS